MELLATRLGLCRVEADDVHVLDVPYASFTEVLAEHGSFQPLESAAVSQTIPRSEVLDDMLLSPVGRSSAVWGVGLNYHSKVIATQRAIPSEPLFFLASGAAVSAPGMVIEYPEGCTTEFDYEAEIAAVIGRRMYRVDPRDSWTYIAAITAANDMTARDVMRQTNTPALAKSFPGCKPIGASLLTVESPEDLDTITVRSYVNGELRQEDTSDGMVWPIAELLSRLSWFAPLEPGDVFLSGTPSGTGQDRNEFLMPGDVMEIQVAGIQPLRNTVSATPLSEAGRTPGPSAIS